MFILIEFNIKTMCSLRSMAVLSSRAHERRRREKNFQVAPALMSSRFLCPRPSLLLGAPNQNRQATQAKRCENKLFKHL